MANGSTDLKKQLTAMQGIALVVGLAAAAALGYGYTVDKHSFFTAYLTGYMYVFGLAVGSLGWLLIHHLCNGRWGFVMRRILEASARTFPLWALLFVPVILGMHELYVWTHEEHIQHHEVLGRKTAWLNHDAFVIRAAIYFAIFLVLSWLLTLWSRRQDKTGDADLSRKMRFVSGPGLVVFGTAGTFAMFDWMMSLEPAWFSTVYGVHALVGMGLTTLAFVAILLNYLSKRGGLEGLATPQQFHDIGNLMFAFTILWTYMNLGQLIIIWSGNLPEENIYYLARMKGSWRLVCILLTLFQFALPFLLLLMRNFKRRSEVLARIAWIVIVMRIVDYHWLIGPASEPDGIVIHWMDIASPIAFFGIWFALFVGFLKRQALLPLHDPFFTHLLEGDRHEEIGWEIGDEGN